MATHFPSGYIYLEGLAGCGKTTAAVEYALHAIQLGVRADQLLIWVPQRTLARPYSQALYNPQFRCGPRPDILTLGGFARRSISLFWPLIAQEAGFDRPENLPIFLTLETAQYSLARLVDPLLNRGYFDSVTIGRNRLYAQVIDNLNKSAVVGFPYTEIGIRLKEAWSGTTSQTRVYDDAQEAATLFRRYCLEHNLLDYSLQIEVFNYCLWSQPQFQEYLSQKYQHLLVDNLEEDVPVSHDLLASWLPRLSSALLICDRQAGYRRFLGADPTGAERMQSLCTESITFNRSFVIPPPLSCFAQEIGRILNREVSPRDPDGLPDPSENIRAGLSAYTRRYHIEMVAWASEVTRRLVVDQNIDPGEIVILAPFISDALRFSLMHSLEKFGIPARSHRPSRSLHAEPPVQALLTLACLAHPGWGEAPLVEDVAVALNQAIASLDPVRAHLLAKIVYRKSQPEIWLSTFDQIAGPVKERISLTLGKAFTRLRDWLLEYIRSGEALELDHFLSRIFGEVLSQPHFGFHRRLDAAEAVASLVESVRKFRWEMGAELTQQGLDPGIEYLRMVRAGLLAAQYLPKWQAHAENAVLISPAHTFLMSNRVVSYQIWLDVGGPGWWERLHQPLTQPYVLSRNWQRGRLWTDDLEFEANQENLYSLCLGLLNRCQKGVYLGISELGESGFEQKGPLLSVVERILRRNPLPTQDSLHV